MHGVWVEEALDAVAQLVEVATDRGRSTVRVIHGSSTSANHARSIKNELHAALDRNDFAGIASDFRQQDVTLLSLQAFGQVDKRLITLFDIR